jgi:thioredoxin 1
MEINDNNFNQTIAADRLTFIEFGAEWCGPCRAMIPVMTELTKKYEGKVNVGSMDIDYNPTTTMRLNITSVPTFIFFKNSQPIERMVGAQSITNFEKKIEEFLK